MLVCERQKAEHLTGMETQKAAYAKEIERLQTDTETQKAAHANEIERLHTEHSKDIKHNTE